MFLMTYVLKKGYCVTKIHGKQNNVTKIFGSLLRKCEMLLGDIHFFLLVR